MAFPSHINTYKHNRVVNDDTMRQLEMLSPRKIIDFGAGDGFYGKLLRYLFPTCYVSAVEVEPSYIQGFELNNYYDDIILDDLMNVIDNIPTGYDLAIFGDVIEHLDKEVAEEVIRKANVIFPYILINSPVGFQPQEHEFTSEIHRCGLHKEMFADYVILEWNHYEDNTMFNCLLKGKV